MATLIAWGKIPHPRASNSSLETALKTRLIEISKGQELDPEVPDNLLSVLIPAMRAQNVSDSSIVNTTLAIQSLNDSATGPAGGTLDTTPKSTKNSSILDQVIGAAGSISDVLYPGLGAVDYLSNTVTGKSLYDNVSEAVSGILEGLLG